MAKQFPEITDRLGEFIAAQSMYFVATAARDGRVNLSPKGLDSLRVLSPNRVAWLNLTGSGNETSAHLLDNPRMTLMFCSFDREPLILRLYGTAREVQPKDADWAELYSQFPPRTGTRQIYDLAVDLVQTSCGFGVPTMTLDSERALLDSWAEKNGVDGVAAYQQERNLASIDGAPTRLALD
ncbi:pyridoxamine 5'-phosphate oxidase family protein [Mycobacterium sp. CBMA293]|uniref:pyridoxamine 5'-phosphate oxidase family protein n=1 Tax=unclassified Mycolicibacterium TaxID=2636767 RepID=UPI0012DBDCE3|nr:MULTISPECIES: pyridoxamine 5'-phosphate oxidase family protein [unclassified Mycolicibacterium]MUL47946.1 pyridoxamine 5'-phosphate oxidase family protein [Mycolicibacterium sp. CBMA 360]MUL59206.1 pyridoxamine 5'-phosphate oxidase family protein [Mycolicibacterium sp. CBMA 335]MUL70931.1 pyridoxamine 5'-phosphate oxidase family protein [Mycolicibacterium sp. CBMA 311]MUL94574.1 pyridoxamine 5'-phosphate oxidase family protein [Mycolicibacterium sp. CBMA 230]MUM09249.1 pyridoxamine 5'-phosp